MAKHAPQDLSGEAKKLYQEVHKDFDLLPHQDKLLIAACFCWARICKYRKMIEDNGEIFTDRYGQPRERPEVVAERQTMSLFMRLCRELALDVNVSDSRPPTLY
jgi:hypothetical protein